MTVHKIVALAAATAILIISSMGHDVSAWSSASRRPLVVRSSHRRRMSLSSSSSSSSTTKDVTATDKEEEEEEATAAKATTAATATATTATTTEETERDMSNPSTAFGRPLSDEVKEFDVFAVGLIKNVIFDNLFRGEDRAYARFYALETIARMPYFAYTSVLHFLETFGRWRKAEYLKIHFAEDWNELHHLMIMEELGGNESWFDRFVAQNVALVYYFMVFAAYLYNPTLAYNLNEAVEEHAFLTYDTFLNENEARLKTLPAPQVAQEYYRDGDLWLFDEFQAGTCTPRRPKMDTLYDCFVAIRDDELQHMETMAKLQTSVQLSTPHSFHSLEECVLDYDKETGVPTLKTKPYFAK